MSWYILMMQHPSGGHHLQSGHKNHFYMKNEGRGELSSFLMISPDT
ncbi:hypothetical protein [Amphritea balenae]|nr:hypothetical protein [Amphritea balenae]